MNRENDCCEAGQGRAGAQQTTLFLAGPGSMEHQSPALVVPPPWSKFPTSLPTLVESDKGGIARTVKLRGEVSRSYSPVFLILTEYLNNASAMCMGKGL